MYALIKENSKDAFPMLLNGEFKVGKLNADLILQNDKSISGTHAIIRLNGTTNKSLELEDIGSKNGTYHNEGITKRKLIPKNVPIKLEVDDLIQFGVLGNIWRVTVLKICTASSGLSSTEIEILEECLKVLHGEHCLNWNDSCNHLTMREIRVTLKVMYALLDEVNIVSVDYWRDLIKVSNKEMKGPLKLEDYIPRVSDVLLAQQNVDIRKPMNRRSIFADKTFVFLNQKHFETYAPIVEKAGGTSRGLKDGVQKPFLLRKNVIVIQYIPSTESQNSHGTQTINGIVDFLEQNSRRFIPEYEIALAIIHGSTEKYCNPDHKILSNIISSTSTLHDSDSFIVENSNVSSANKLNEPCDLFVFETEDSQKINENSELLPNHNSKDSKKPEFLGKTTNDNNSRIESTKKRMHDVICTDDEFEQEEIICPAKKISTEKSKQCNNSNSSAIDSPSKQNIGSKHKNAYRTLNITVSKSPRRRRLPNMSDDEDDLFNFGEEEPQSVTSTKKRRFELPSEETEEENPFQFTEKTKTSPDKSNEVVCDLDDIATQPFVPKSKPKSLVKPLPKPKKLPERISSVGWKTCSGKKDSDILCQSDTGPEPLNSVHFNNTSIDEQNDSKCLTGGFCVKINAALLSRLNDISLQATDKKSNVLDQNYSWKERNFKKFVKQKRLQLLS